MVEVHPTAIVEPDSKLGENVIIGPYCSVGANVIIGDGCRLVSHAVVAGNTSIGANTHIYPFASIGHPPQDMKFKGEPSKLLIGANNIIREHVTMNPGTEGGGMVTQIGNNCLFMVGSHVAHDGVIGNHVIFANNATVAGHVVVEDYAILGGLCAVHQFVRIGCHAMIGGMSGVEQDVIPYGSVLGNRARLAGLNVVGIRRRGFSRSEIADLRKAYRLLFAEEGSMSERLVDVSEMYKENEAVMEIVDFIRGESSRSICQPRTEHGT
ncbi:MAG: acyl-[acyl-carrier-protein]--UDP-N-acetylglucosamine O-acyltransferase [Rhodospirillaceae bacterium]|nr:acyl-[acyl-carrier-protein]--UDP-N-acetylglucosamine O-acyltransferase [Rhodospirillaceae bacterium]